MKINIYTSLNGVGLERDYLLVKDVLERAGHITAVSDWKVRQGATKGDLALHMEVPRYDLVRHCPVNVIIPNAEWFDKKWLPRLKDFDFMFAKTQDCVGVFKKYHKNIIHTGFISEDLYLPFIEKKRIFLHVAGQSRTKGTPALVHAYKMNKDLPRCFLLSSNEWECCNELLFCKRIPFDDLKILLNSCAFHICTSEYEGWGHYIHEAIGCGAVVITTDSAPMNEFITDERLLVPENNRIPMHMTERRCVNGDDLADKLREVWELTDDEIVEIGEQNRENFLKRNADFKKKLLNFVDEL